ncbi:Putative DNA methylase [Sphingobacterium sp. PM2-P1-29]|nr:Putative DNA methylase [Sphingobacterium sp. PM2-P1-29]
MVTSNIPFGDTTVFDLSYSRGKILQERKLSAVFTTIFFQRERTCSVKAVLWLS